MDERDLSGVPLGGGLALAVGHNLQLMRPRSRACGLLSGRAVARDLGGQDDPRGYVTVLDARQRDAEGAGEPGADRLAVCGLRRLSELVFHVGLNRGRPGLFQEIDVALAIGRGNHDAAEPDGHEVVRVTPSDGVEPTYRDDVGIDQP